MIHAGLRLAELAVRSALATWRRMSFDAKVVGGLAVFNWALLFQKHTIVMVSKDEPLWLLFPGLAAPAYLLATGAAACLYPLRDLRSRAAFTSRDRWLHLGALVFLFVVLPAVAAMILRATGKPYTFIHDGALMAEEAARKLLAGQNPYSADYLDTPLFYWPMVNNPALYHFTYFPLLFLATIPPLVLLQTWVGWFDERVLFLPAMLGALAVARALVHDTGTRLAVVGAIALNPQFFPFVVEGRNDAFVLFFVLLAILFLRGERLPLAGAALAVATASKLHAMLLVPFFFTYVLARARPRTRDAAWRALAPAAVPFLALNAIVFAPFLVWDFLSFYDDIVLYNAGASAWSYPISGIGFSVLLHGLGVIPYRGAEFPFWALELAAAIPVMVWSLRKVWREPALSTAILGYAATLLAFLFFGRYFQTSYLGYVVAAATPAFFLADRAPRRVVVPAIAASASGAGAPARKAQPVPAAAGK